MNLNSRLLKDLIRRTPAVCLTGAVVLAPPAMAGTKTASMSVSAVVNSACSVVATPVAFGLYETTGAAVDADGQVAVTCAVGTAYAVGLNAGAAASASTAARKLDSSAGQLSYNLYQDAARSVVWGNAVGADTVSGTYAAGQQPLTVHGRIAGGQPAAAGAYSDTVTVTITY